MPFSRLQQQARKNCVKKFSNQLKQHKKNRQEKLTSSSQLTNKFTIQFFSYKKTKKITQLDKNIS